MLRVRIKKPKQQEQDCCSAVTGELRVLGSSSSGAGAGASGQGQGQPKKKKKERRSGWDNWR